MKSKDLFVIGGIGLALYLLMPKAKEVAAAGGATTFLPMPTGASALDVGGLFSGMASIFGAMPQQLVPEINIPEFVLPPIVMPEMPGVFEFPDWSKYYPDWEGFLPDISDEGVIPDMSGLIPDIPDLIPDFFGGDGAMVTTFKTGVSIWDAAWNKLTEIITGPIPVVGTFGQLLYDPMTAEFKTKRDIEMEPFIAESEAIFEEAGFSEVTPGNIDIFLKARETVTGEKAETLPSVGSPEYWHRMLGSPEPYRKSIPIPEPEKYPGYSADIELLKKHPYFSTVL